MRYVVTVLVLMVAIGVPAAWAQDEPETVDLSKVEKKIALFNGKDFEGWTFYLNDENAKWRDTWSVKDGVVHCKGTPAGYMRTKKYYTNYRLTFQWRWTEKAGNSGLLMHVSGEDKIWPKAIEGQLMSENAADFWVIGGTDFKEHVNKEERRVPKMHPHNEKPIGEWNSYEAVCDGNTIRLTINGKLQNVATETTVSKGFIGLQSEGAPIEFRNIVLTPVKADEFDVAQAKKVFLKACGTCHSASRVEEHKGDKKPWEKVVAAMRAKGAQVDDDQAATIIAFLNEVYPKE